SLAFSCPAVLSPSSVQRASPDPYAVFRSGRLWRGGSGRSRRNHERRLSKRSGNDPVLPGVCYRFRESCSCILDDREPSWIRGRENKPESNRSRDRALKDPSSDLSSCDNALFRDLE